MEELVRTGKLKPPSRSAYRYWLLYLDKNSQLPRKSFVNVAYSSVSFSQNSALNQF